MHMDDSSFILGVDLDGVVGDFYSAIRKIAAEWLNKPLESLTTEVSFGFDEWGLMNTAAMTDSTVIR